MIGNLGRYSNAFHVLQKLDPQAATIGHQAEFFYQAVKQPYF